MSAVVTASEAAFKVQSKEKKRNMIPVGLERLPTSS